MIKLYWTIVISFVCSIVSSVAQTNYYEVDKTFYKNGYTYQCDIHEGSKMVTLYNKENQYTYVDQIINNGTQPPMENMPRCIEKDNWTKRKCYEIVNNAFSETEKQRMKGHCIQVRMYISPTTGKITEVDYHFISLSPCATTPISVFRAIEVELKNNVWFTPTDYGKTLNYIFLGWNYEFN